MRQVVTEKFSGPLELLLRLIEDQQLDISQVSLATVTDQYLAELQKLEELPIDELSDFLVVAAKLLYIKSRLMVPTAPLDEDDLGTDLERQLRMYKLFVEAAKTVNHLWNKHKITYPREGFGPIEPIFNPPEHLQADDLKMMMLDILKDLEPITRLPQTVLIRTINIRETITRIRDRLMSVKRASYHELISQAKTKTEAIVTFLAVLELVKQQTVTIRQSELHADMDIEIIEIEPEIELVTAKII
jgi:segregation and condensation protein A